MRTAFPAAAAIFMDATYLNASSLLSCVATAIEAAREPTSLGALVRLLAVPIETYRCEPAVIRTLVDVGLDRMNRAQQQRDMHGTSEEVCSVPHKLGK